MTGVVDWTDKVWTWDEPRVKHVVMNGRAKEIPWGEGPWDDEPDKVQWVDPATDLDCLIVRGPMGALCGYVGVAKGHPFFEISYSGCIVPDCEGGWDDEEEHVHPERCVSVHGGLTFANLCVESNEGEAHGICHVPEAGRPAKVYWFGFDCGHAWDVIPGMVAFERAMGFGETFKESVYRDILYVRGQCELLALQLKLHDPQ